jgi:hypothetical protein
MQLEKPSSSRREIGGAVNRITGEPRKSVEDERVADGLIVARKRSNVRGAKGPCCLQFSETQGGKGELTKAPVNLQDLRRRIYVKAKADRFCGF